MLSLQHTSIFITLAFSLFLTSCVSTATTSNNKMQGVITKNQLLTNEVIFKENYLAFSVTEKDKIQINSWPSNLHIDIYFGAWCHDSQREVPKMLSILEHNRDVSFQLIGFNAEKNDPDNLAKIHKIKYTPTFIVYIEGSEVGRIVERPTQNLIEDITRMYVNSLKVID